MREPRCLNLVNFDNSKFKKIFLKKNKKLKIRGEENFEPQFSFTREVDSVIEP